MEHEQGEYGENCLNCNKSITDDNVEAYCQYCGIDCCDSCIEDHEDDCDENPVNQDEEED